MTPDFDKTMDDLLRQHGRRATTRPGGAASFGAGAHLDADALNAFVENALPPATRSRYVTHLADCAACRKVTTALTLASGVSFQEESAAATASVKPPTVTESESSWRAWFAALFNPAVLRYAAPAVVLCAVTIGAFVALRATRETATEQVARNAEAPPFTEKNVAPPTTGDAATANRPANAAPSPQLNETVKPLPNIPAPAATAAPVLREPQPTADAKNAPVEQQSKDLRDVSKERKEAVPESEAAPPPSAVGSAKPQPEDKPIILSAPPKPVTTAVKPPSGPQRGRDLSLDGADNTDSIDRAEANKRENRAGSASGGRGPAKTPMADGGLVASKPAASPAPKAGEESDDADRAKAKKQPAPATRNAGGRAFIRRGGAWVDTACANGCATTTLKRGTDDYKKADSGLRAIADQLGGEVVVLWQGKAYRIQ